MATPPRTFPGYHGLHVREEAPGAMANGTRVRKTQSARNDSHQDGALATVLGSILDPVLGLAYFVEWDSHPHYAVLVGGDRVGAFTACESCGRETVNGHCASCAKDQAEGEEFAARHGMPWDRPLGTGS